MKSCFRLDPAPDRLAINKYALTAILGITAIALFLLRLPGTFRFDNFAFFDTGSNLTAQYLISHGFRPTVDFEYLYGLLPLWLGGIWFRIFGLTPMACVATIPLIDAFIVWGLVRCATNLKLNVAGLLIIVLTAPLTIPSSFLNLTHGIEPIFLIHAIADQSAGNRRRSLALASACLFVKPTMSYLFGAVLLTFIVIDALNNHMRPLQRIVAETYFAALVVAVVGAVLATAFSPKILFNSLIPGAGVSIYRAMDLGFWNGSGRAFIAPRGGSLLNYIAGNAGPWIVYTISLLGAALIVMRRDRACITQGTDHSREVVTSCAILHLGFICIFFGNEFSWIYYFYIPVIGLAAAARLGVVWEMLVACLAFAIPLSKLDKRIVQHFALSRPATDIVAAGRAADSTAPHPLPVEPAFTYQLWFTSSPSPETHGLWVSPDERAEWIKVLDMIRRSDTSLLEYYGCADVIFSEFRPPVTLYLVPGGAGPAEILRKVSQIETSSMLVIPRSHSGLLMLYPKIGDVVRHDFVPLFQGSYFIVYTRSTAENSAGSSN